MSQSCNICPETLQVSHKQIPKELMQHSETMRLIAAAVVVVGCTHAAAVPSTSCAAPGADADSFQVNLNISNAGSQSAALVSTYSTLSGDLSLHVPHHCTGTRYTLPPLLPACDSCGASCTGGCGHRTALGRYSGLAAVHVFLSWPIPFYARRMALR
jgi:hypothetical protein